MIYEKRALKVLFDTYWGPKGWKSASRSGWVPETAPGDFAYAQAAGLMFLPQRDSHDAAIERLGSLRARIMPRDVGSAFVASLSTRQPGIRSALGSAAVALTFPRHAFSQGKGGFSCNICGTYETKGERDLNVLNFERHKWGGVRHSDPFYVAFDLERFLTEPKLAPSAKDWRILHAILRAVETTPTGSKLADLLKALTSLVPGNESQRRTLIGLLGYAGILQIPGHPGFLRAFTPSGQRLDTPWSKDDWPYPTRWWRGGNGVDQDAVSFWFGPEGSG